MGPRQSEWFARGYQSAMEDVYRELQAGGIDAVAEWVRNNRAVPQTSTRARRKDR